MMHTGTWAGHLRRLLLLVEIVLVMKLSPEESKSKSSTLGVAVALMIILGYPGELIVEGDLGTRWQYWALAMVPVLYIVYELLVGLAGATQLETDPSVKDLIFRAQWVTVASWLTYSVVYVFPKAVAGLLVAAQTAGSLPRGGASGRARYGFINCLPG